MIILVIFAANRGLAGGTTIHESNDNDIDLDCDGFLKGLHSILARPARDMFVSFI